MFSPTLHSLLYHLLVYYFTCICYIILLLFIVAIPLSYWLCVTGVWVGAGFRWRGSWLGYIACSSLCMLHPWILASSMPSPVYCVLCNTRNFRNLLDRLNPP